MCRCICTERVAPGRECKVSCLPTVQASLRQIVDNCLHTQTSEGVLVSTFFLFVPAHPKIPVLKADGYINGFHFLIPFRMVKTSAHVQLYNISFTVNKLHSSVVVWLHLLTEKHVCFATIPHIVTTSQDKVSSRYSIHCQPEQGEVCN